MDLTFQLLLSEFYFVNNRFPVQVYGGIGRVIDHRRSAGFQFLSCVIQKLLLTITGLQSPTRINSIPIIQSHNNYIGRIPWGTRQATIEQMSEVYNQGIQSPGVIQEAHQLEQHSQSSQHDEVWNPEKHIGHPTDEIIYKVQDVADPSHLEYISQILPVNQRQYVPSASKNHIAQSDNMFEAGHRAKGVAPAQIPSALKPHLIRFLKGKFILQQIIDQIQCDQLLNIKNEVYLEFMFLVSSRCANNLRSAQRQFKNQTDLFELNFEIETNAMKASAKLQAYSSMINVELRGIRRRIKSVTEIVYKSVQKVTKYKFLDGLEGLDYTEQQQIEFTYDKYIEQVLNSKAICSPFFKNHRLKKILKKYRQICNIDEQGVRDESEFENQVKQILLSA